MALAIKLRSDRRLIGLPDPKQKAKDKRRNRGGNESKKDKERAAALLIAGIGEPVVKQKGETTQAALERSASKTARTFSRANPTKDVSVEVSLTPTARTETPSTDTQPEKKQRFQSFYDQGSKKFDPSGFVTGKSFDIKTSDTTSKSFTLSRTPQDFSEFTIKPNLTDRAVFFLGHDIVRDPAFFGKTPQSVANVNEKIFGSQGFGKQVDFLVENNQKFDVNPVSRFAASNSVTKGFTKNTLEFFGGGVKYAARDPVLVGVTGIAGQVAGVVVGGISYAATPAVTAFKSAVPMGTAAIKGIKIGGTIGGLGLFGGLAAKQVASSKKPAEEAGKIAVDLVAFGFGFKTGLKAGKSGAASLKNQFANTRAEILNQELAGKLTIDAKPKTLVKLKKGDVVLKGQQLEGIQFSGSQTGSGTTTFRKNLFGKIQKINPKEIQRADFFKLSFKGTKVSVNSKPLLTTGNTPNTKFNFIVGKKADIFSRTTIKGSSFISKDQGKFILGSEGFGKSSQKVGQLSFLRGKANLQGFKFGGGSGVVKTGKNIKFPRLERSKPLTSVQVAAQRGLAGEVGFPTSKPPFRPPFEGFPVKVKAKPVKIFKVSQVLAKQNKVVPVATKPIEAASGGSATITLLKTETQKVKPISLKQELSTAQKSSQAVKIEVKSKSQSKLFKLQKRSRQDFKVDVKQDVAVKPAVAFASITGVSSISGTASIHKSATSNIFKQPQSTDVAQITIPAVKQIPAVDIGQTTAQRQVFQQNPFRSLKLDAFGVKGFRQTFPKMPSLPSFTGNKGLFFVEVRRKGEFKKVGQNPFKLPKAVKVGKNVVQSTAAASFRLKPVSNAAFNFNNAFKGLGGQFRSSKTEKGVFVQKSRFRIGSIGEKQQITLKGIAASKGKKRKKNTFGGFF